MQAALKQVSKDNNSSVMNIPSTIVSSSKNFGQTPIRNFHQVLDRGSGPQNFEKKSIFQFFEKKNRLIEFKKKIFLDSSIYYENNAPGLKESNVVNGIDFSYNTENSTSHHSVFDTDRNSLISQIEKLRKQLTEKKIVEEDSKHFVPISEMGNYHEVLMKRETLRDIDEEKGLGPILFGNPYRKEKV